jgi:hypothetical protein
LHLRCGIADTLRTGRTQNAFLADKASDDVVDGHIGRLGIYCGLWLVVWGTHAGPAEH